MLKGLDTIYSIRHLDELSRMESAVHRIHPVSKVLTTLVYLIVVVSFGKYEISSLLPFFFYPVMLFAFSEIPVAPILKKLLLVCPFILGIGILNPFFETQTFTAGGLVFSQGWITFLSIVIKSMLTVTASILLLATTGMDKIGYALRILKVPKLFVLQLLLTYRYISVLMEEVGRMTTAYSLRAPGQRGIAFHAWGSFTGQLVLRTFDRASRIYQSMILRGFDGEYHTGGLPKESRTFRDISYFIAWSSFFILGRILNIPALFEMLIKGGFSS